MTFRLPHRIKTVAQHIVPVASFMLVHRTTDEWLTAFRAFLAALQGFGAGSPVQREAVCASRLISASIESPVIIDAGANVGSWAEAISVLLERRATIYMFEPLPAAQRRLESKLSGAEVVPLALGDLIEERDLFLSHDLDTTSSLHPRLDSMASGRLYRCERVKVITLDYFLAERNIERVDFLKMDLEGNELAALRGAQHALEAKILRALSFEFGSSNLNSRTFFRDFFDLLTTHSYKLQRMLPTGTLVPIASYNEDLEFFGRTTTYFASVE